MMRSVAFVATLLAVGACERSPVEVLRLQPYLPPSPAPLPTPEPPTELRLSGQFTTLDFVGLKRLFTVEAYSRTQRRVDSETARVVSSDTTVAMIVHLGTTSVLDYQTDIITKSLVATIAEVGEGTAIITASLGGLTTSEPLHVMALPTRPAQLEVDSFSVADISAVACAGPCGYRIYAPLLKLREPSGTARAFVEAVEFTIPTTTTGWSWAGNRTYCPGMSSHLNQVGPYLWDSDYLLVILSGIPVPEGVGRARVIVKDERGERGLIEVTGPILPLADMSLLPQPNWLTC
jgi:hypothetical protein